MKRLFRVKRKPGRKQWFVVADHFPAAQKAVVEAGFAANTDQVAFVADLTDEYLGMEFAGLKELLRSRTGLGNQVVDIETKISKRKGATRKFVGTLPKKSRPRKQDIHELAGVPDRLEVLGDTITVKEVGLYELELSIPVTNNLEAGGIHYIRQLTNLTPWQVLDIPRIDLEMLTEIRDKLNSRGLHLRNDQFYQPPAPARVRPN